MKVNNLYSLSKTLRFELKPLTFNKKGELVENKEVIKLFELKKRQYL